MSTAVENEVPRKVFADSDGKAISIEDLLREGKTVQFHPEGNSMFPLFVAENDYAIVSPVRAQLARGDVCVYRRSTGKLVIHRIYQINNGKAYFIGDRQIEIEGPLDFESVIGVMVAFIRNRKEYSVEYLPYRLYSEIWLAMRPIRPLLFKIGHILKVLFYKIRRKNIEHWY